MPVLSTFLSLEAKHTYIILYMALCLQAGNYWLSNYPRIHSKKGN